MADRVPGELSTGDIVTVFGLKSEKGKELNGKKGTIIPSQEHGTYTVNRDFDKDPGKALRKDGRYTVIVTLEENQELAPSRLGPPKTATVKIKRENLRLVSGNIQSMLSESELRAEGMTKTADLEERHPGMKGLYPAVGEGDHVRLREIMEYIKKEWNTDYAADHNLDGTGSTALLGAVQHGHLEAVKVLLEYGADTNAPVGPFNPTLKELDHSILHMAIYCLLHSFKTDQKIKDGEVIVDLLLENGADVKKISKSNGSVPILLLSVSSPKLHDTRMRILRKILERGANPNDLAPFSNPSLGQKLPIVDAVLMKYAGPPEHRTQVVELLLEYGADPGKVCKRHDEYVNAIIMASNHRLTTILEVLLKSKKGRMAVDSKHVTNDVTNGESSLQMTLADEVFEKKSDTSLREVAVILLKYGANMYQSRDNGVQPFHWLDNSNKHKELKRIFNKAPKRSKQEATLDYWDITKNEKVRAFVGVGSGHQCPVCLMWSDHMKGFQGRTSSGFKKCSQCQDQMYCSKECQKKHWPYHKTVCKKVVCEKA